MLVQFSLKNFRNFKDTAILDLTEAKITEMKSHVYQHRDGMGILPMAVIYGANGSGKTNFLKGLWTLRNLVVDAPSVSLKNCPFLFHEECKRLPVEFGVVFRIKDREYKYELKITEQLVEEEKLYGRNLTDDSFDVLLDRDGEGVFLCEVWEDTDVTVLAEDTPLLYILGKKQKEKELQSIINYFRSIVYVSGETINTCFLQEVLQKEQLKNELYNHLHHMGMTVQSITRMDESFVICHEKHGVKVTFDWKEESAGICRLINLLAMILIARKKGMLIVLDTPELQLNPKMVGYLYRLVSKEQTGPVFGQMICATHENSTMNNKIFRRDEVWLMGQKEDGSSTLYTLALFLKENGEKVRKDETYFKQYLEGRYGACPRIEY